MTENAVRVEEFPRLNRSGVARMLTVLLFAVLVAVIFFAAAGTLEVRQAWIYFGAIFVYLLVTWSVILALVPGAAEIVNERGKLKKDVKAWDKAFGLIYTLLMLGQPALAGLDVGRHHWSRAPEDLAWPSVVLTLLAYLLATWVMLVNKHAETGVRIQQDRHHQVVSKGPYCLVRHPFYLSLIVIQLVYPLALGSLYAYLPSALIITLFIWRTTREDATLQAELPGYADYATRVKYRLLPGVW